jgi:hypothetical protein
MELVNAVVPLAEVLPYTYNYARTLITNVSLGSLQEIKRQIYPDPHRDVRSVVADAAALLERMATEPDFVEGVSAFLQNDRHAGPRRGKASELSTTPVVLSVERFLPLHSLIRRSALRPYAAPVEVRETVHH